jgi:hypothetical protein
MSAHPLVGGFRPGLADAADRTADRRLDRGDLGLGLGDQLRHRPVVPAQPGEERDRQTAPPLIMLWSSDN